MVLQGKLRKPLLTSALLGLVVACSSNAVEAPREDAASGGSLSVSGGASATGGAGTGGAAPAMGGAGQSAGGTEGATGGTATGGAGGSATTGVGGTTSGGTGTGGSSAAGGTNGGSFDGKELFLLIGQSNMSGMSPMPTEPWPLNERVTFMVQFDCASLDQAAGEWLTAQPPLHGCQWATGGIGLGLADFFGAKLAEEWSDSKIGLIPNAIPGQVISIYLKDGATEAPIPPGYTDAYDMTVKRSLKAQEQGRIRAILMHQGESDYNKGLSEQWLERVAQVVADLRTDLNLGEEVPFLAGQIGPSQWEGHNAYVDQIPDYIPNSAVISSEGTAIHDVAHFDIASAKLMGERYADKFLEMITEP